MVAGNLFSLVFGRNLDAHGSSSAYEGRALNPPLIYSTPQCLQGPSCYVDTIYLTMLATFLCILLSIWAGYRDRLKIAMSHKTKLANRSEAVWQDEEEG